MYKRADSSDEIFQSMQASLAANQTEAQYGFRKISRALELLATAADIFDQHGMSQEAGEVSAILESLSNEVGK